MKTTVLTITTMLLFMLSSKAQLQMGLAGSFLQGQGNADNHTSLGGAGLTLKYFLTNRMAIGAVLHYYLPKSSNYVDKSTSYTGRDFITNLSAGFDFLLGNEDNAVQPYIGLDAGMSLSGHNITYTNSSNQKVEVKRNQGYFLISPKAGLRIDLDDMFGIFGQAQYNYGIGNGNYKNLPLNNGQTTLTTEPISKYVNLDAGLYYRF